MRCAGGGVQTERECDRGGLSLRIEIKMNGEGAGGVCSVHSNKGDKQRHTSFFFFF